MQRGLRIAAVVIFQLVMEQQMIVFVFFLLLLIPLNHQAHVKCLVGPLQSKHKDGCLGGCDGFAIHKNHLKLIEVLKKIIIK